MYVRLYVCIYVCMFVCIYMKYMSRRIARKGWGVVCIVELQSQQCNGPFPVPHSTGITCLLLRLPRPVDLGRDWYARWESL